MKIIIVLPSLPNVTDFFKIRGIGAFTKWNFKGKRIEYTYPRTCMDGPIVLRTLTNALFKKPYNC